MKRFFVAFCNILLLLFLWLWFFPFFLYHSFVLQPEYGKKWIVGKEFLLDDLLAGVYLEAGLVCAILNWLIIILMPIVAPIYFIIDMYQRRHYGAFCKIITGKDFLLEV